MPSQQCILAFCLLEKCISSITPYAILAPMMLESHRLGRLAGEPVASEGEVESASRNRDALVQSPDQMETPSSLHSANAKFLRRTSDQLAFDQLAVSTIPESDAKQDIDAILWSMRLCWIRRYFHHRFWEAETQDAEYADRIEPMPRLESVAEHSWHVADTVLLLAGHFPQLNTEHCVTLAVLHDKMEISIGDQSPIGRDGTGRATHAFDPEKQQSKAISEHHAIESYLSRLRPSAREVQAQALFELLEGESWEARFVKAIDKLQALGFVVVKKRGNLSDRHLDFTLRYSLKTLHYFPALAPHYYELRSRLLQQVARHRDCSVRRIDDWFNNHQLALNFDGGV